MKVNSTKHGGPPESKAAKAELDRTDQARRGTDVGAGGGRIGRDFASVLGELSRSGGGVEATESGVDERVEEEAHRAEKEAGTSGEVGGEELNDLVLDSRGGSVEAASRPEVLEARTILRSADLEKIVAAIHTQIIGGGRREVTLELSRSVLSGLRVRLIADGSGRVAAEFIAADGRVRALLEGRSQELAEILRSRGINLSSLKTTADGGGSGQGDEGRGGPSQTQEVEGAEHAPRSGPDMQPAQPSADDKGQVSPTTGYRA
jgi:hypothetical protein